MMRFGQAVHPYNFEYGNALAALGDGFRITGKCFQLQIHCEEIGDFCTRLTFENSNVLDKRYYSDAVVEGYRQGRSVPGVLDGTGGQFRTKSGLIEIGPRHLRVSLVTGAVFETAEGGIGIIGERFLLNFRKGNASGFYGFGERTKRFNKNGDTMNFWNVDVVAAFPHTYQRDDYDPAYVAVPLAIVKTGDIFTGIFFDNPERVVIDVGKVNAGQWFYQSMGGNNRVYFISGPSLRDVVRDFTRLTGRAEVPALWSIGYHQCRWGYRSEADFRSLRDCFQLHEVPVSALWYDIDYMDSYRLFTWNRESFPQPAVLNQELRKAGIRAVAIVDPGIKLEPGYLVYDDGEANAVFCKTPIGRNYVGRVWPGDTVFPDFPLQRVRLWWADALARFVKDSAIDGLWLDMNDPATGFSSAEEMFFESGTVPHSKYHNQYGHLMAKASHEAFTQIDCSGRPFLLTRSGFAGTQRYSAVWTGDNVSSWTHLRMAIPSALNLGLSGMAFNGPDVGGFLANPTVELLIRWYQACFLFPFFRNHSAWNSRPQEPWQFGPRCLACVRETIRTRYRLLPYLYQCFFNHYLSGDPVLRPLLYEYAAAEFENLDDQYLIGANILVAPILVAEGQGREIFSEGVRRQLRPLHLPPGWWFDLNTGEWTAGGRIMSYPAALEEVPLFIRDGSIIPYFNGPLRNAPGAMTEIELHIFSRQRPGKLSYYIDDQETRAYQTGCFNVAEILARVSNGEVNVTIAERGQFPVGTVDFIPVLYGCQGQWRAVTLSRGKSAIRSLTAQHREWVCKRLPVLA
jgi:alpha-glucosidase